MSYELENNDLSKDLSNEKEKIEFKTNLIGEKIEQLLKLEEKDLNNKETNILLLQSIYLLSNQLDDLKSEIIKLKSKK
jgi:hypothetical protein